MQDRRGFRHFRFGPIGWDWMGPFGAMGFWGMRPPPRRGRYVEMLEQYKASLEEWQKELEQELKEVNAELEELRPKGDAGAES